MLALVGPSLGGIPLERAEDFGASHWGACIGYNLCGQDPPGRRALRTRSSARSRTLVPSVAATPPSIVAIVAFSARAPARSPASASAAALRYRSARACARGDGRGSSTPPNAPPKRPRVAGLSPPISPAADGPGGEAPAISPDEASRARFDSLLRHSARGTAPRLPSVICLGCPPSSPKRLDSVHPRAIPSSGPRFLALLGGAKLTRADGWPDGSPERSSGSGPKGTPILPRIDAAQASLRRRRQAQPSGRPDARGTSRADLIQGPEEAQPTLDDRSRFARRGRARKRYRDGDLCAGHALKVARASPRFAQGPGDRHHLEYISRRRSHRRRPRADLVSEPGALAAPRAHLDQAAEVRRHRAALPPPGGMTRGRHPDGAAALRDEGDRRGFQARGSLDDRRDRGSDRKSVV